MFYSQVYDDHTLFVKCGDAKIEQIRDLFYETLRKYEADNNINLHCDFHVNLVENREGISFGIAFVFVTNSDVYYMLLGKNPDGTDRIKYIDDPSWSAPENIIEVSEAIYPPGISWAELDEIDRDFDLQKAKFTCPKIPMHLDPLIKLCPYKSGDTLSHVSIFRACAPILDNRFMPNVLKSKNVPKFVTERQIKAIFQPYVSDKLTKHIRVINGKHHEDTYPFVNINNNRIAFVVFDPTTNDAAFALHLLKKVDVNDGHVFTTLLFSNSYRLDRDSEQKYNKSRNKKNQKNEAKAFNIRIYQGK